MVSRSQGHPFSKRIAFHSVSKRMTFVATYFSERAMPHNKSSMPLSISLTSNSIIP